MVKGFCRCGICDIDFESTEEWDKHAKTAKHKRMVEIGLAVWKERPSKKELIPKAHQRYKDETKFVFR